MPKATKRTKVQTESTVDLGDGLTMHVLDSGHRIVVEDGDPDDAVTSRGPNDLLTLPLPLINRIMREGRSAVPDALYSAAKGEERNALDELIGIASDPMAAILGTPTLPTDAERAANPERFS